MNKIIKFINRMIIFFDLWGDYWYEVKIDAKWAWELAGIFEEHSDALEGFEPL
jgi:hypothetical protein